MWSIFCFCVLLWVRHALPLAWLCKVEDCGEQCCAVIFETTTFICKRIRRDQVGKTVRGGCCGEQQKNLSGICSTSLCQGDNFVGKLDTVGVIELGNVVGEAFNVRLDETNAIAAQGNDGKHKSVVFLGVGRHFVRNA